MPTTCSNGCAAGRPSPDEDRPDGSGRGRVGWVHCAEHQLLETGRRCELLGLVVDARVRGRGVGRRLVTAAEGWAAARGLEQMAVRSNVARSDSHPFYERLGYVRVKTQHAYRKRLEL
jgi:GNAT superfamily N-acetyltransferase